MARRFAAGATLWCAAPEWPWHARHVAVEFVHPVVVGKRALAAVALSDQDVLGELRAVSRAGDILLCVGTADAQALPDLTRLARVWGLSTVWLGAGGRPAFGAADHVLWRAESVDEAAFGGGFVLSYHLLWELTHVCFEHPGMLLPEACDDDHCITCADEGRPAEVLAVSGSGTARVRSAAGIESVDVSLVEDPRPGDVLLVHAGTAISALAGGRP